MEFLVDVSLIYCRTSVARQVVSRRLPKCDNVRELTLVHVNFQNLNHTYNANVPLVLMNSFNTHEDTLQVFQLLNNHSLCYKYFLNYVLFADLDITFISSLYPIDSILFTYLCDE